MADYFEVPAGELEGRELDIAVREEVMHRPGYAVDPEGVEAEMSMSGAITSGGLRLAWSSEAEEYENDQKTVVAPPYSSNMEQALKLHAHMLREHRSRAACKRFLDLQHGGEIPGGVRGIGEEADTIDGDPEEVARNALRAVHGPREDEE